MNAEDQPAEYHSGSQHVKCVAHHSLLTAADPVLIFPDLLVEAVKHGTSRRNRIRPLTELRGLYADFLGKGRGCRQRCDRAPIGQATGPCVQVFDTASYARCPGSWRPGSCCRWW